MIFTATFDTLGVLFPGFGTPTDGVGYVERLRTSGDAEWCAIRPVCHRSVIRYHRPERTIAVWAASWHSYTQGDVWLTRTGAMGTGIPPVGRPGASRGQRKSVHRVDDAVNL